MDARAVGIHRFGGPEVLEVVRREVPEPGPGQVRVRVAGAAVNPADTLLRAGITSSRLGDLPPPFVPGLELSGTVEAIGDGVSLAVGDRVMAMTTAVRPEGGAQSELVLLPADSVAAVPPGLDLIDAATVPMNGLTARLALDKLALAPGSFLAVTGAAGVVGSYVIQLATLAGLRIVADAAPRDRALVESYGAHEVVERGQGFTAAVTRVVPGGVAAVVDAALVGPGVAAMLGSGGRVAAVRPVDYGDGVPVELVSVPEYAGNAAALAELGTLAATGRLQTRVVEVCGPERAGDAHRRLAEGGLRGRWVIGFG